jgi:hypothetical protein
MSHSTAPTLLSWRRLCDPSWWEDLNRQSPRLQPPGTQEELWLSLFSSLDKETVGQWKNRKEQESERRKICM